MTSTLQFGTVRQSPLLCLLTYCQFIGASIIYDTDLRYLITPTADFVLYKIV